MRRAVFALLLLGACATHHRPIPQPNIVMNPAAIIVTSLAPTFGVVDEAPARPPCRPPQAPKLPGKLPPAPDLATAISQANARAETRDKLHADYERRLLAALKDCSRSDH